MKLSAIRRIFTGGPWLGRFLSRSTSHERNDGSVNFEFGGVEFCRECSESWGGTGILYQLVWRRLQQRNMFRSVHNLWLLLLNRRLRWFLKASSPARQSWRESKRKDKNL